jgi:fido (protein-threonine AMPylation protein)
MGAKRVPALVEDLFAWVQVDSRTAPLVTACVAHYELEFIHPFSDGNGRSLVGQARWARLMQSPNWMPSKPG